MLDTTIFDFFFLVKFFLILKRKRFGDSYLIWKRSEIVSFSLFGYSNI